MKHKHVEPDDSDDKEDKERLKNEVCYNKHLKKWQQDFDKEFQSLTWLDCVTTFQSRKKVFIALHVCCLVCCRRIQSLHIYFQ